MSLDFDLDTDFQFAQKVHIFSHLLPIKLYFYIEKQYLCQIPVNPVYSL